MTVISCIPPAFHSSWLIFPHKKNTLPLISTSSTRELLSLTSPVKRCIPSLLLHKLSSSIRCIKPAQPPPRIPCYPPSSQRRPPSAVVAWLTGHSDAFVISAAALSGRRVVPVRGSLLDMIAKAHGAHATHVYLSRRVVTAETLSVVSLSNLIAVPVLSSPPSSSSVRAFSFGKSQMPYPGPVFSMAAVAITAPLLIERKGDSTLRFFEQEDTTSVTHTPRRSKGAKHGLKCERERDDRPLVERITSYLTQIYLPRGFPHTTTPDYISFTKFRTIQNLASAIMSVIRFVLEYSTLSCLFPPLSVHIKAFVF